jgi:hypothetical protein
MKFREHRGSLDDSMATLVELEDRAALVRHVENLHGCFIHNYDFNQLIVKPYFMEPDDRCGWKQTWIVSLPGYGPIGYTDSPLPGETRLTLEEAKKRFPPMWTIYNDYPGKVLVRLCYGEFATDEVWIHDSLIEAREHIVTELGGCLPLRSPGDDPSIVETWV